VDEADELAATSAELAAGDDLITQAMWRGVRARAALRRGRAEEAESLAREAVALASRTDFVNHRADALADLGMVLRALGPNAGAQAAFDEALALYEGKGNVVAAERLRADLVAPART
jgi:tetratricopeptide (TPR) repeat protein